MLGGGYTGLSTALHLAQLAKENNVALNIIVLEGGRVGSAASGKSGGSVTPGFQEHDEKAVLKLFPSKADGEQALALINQGPALVRSIIGEHDIDCDLRDGYVVLGRNGASYIEDGSQFGIEPYPFVLGMAQAARDLGVKIFEDTRVENIVERDGHVDILTSRGVIAASEMLAAGGHSMAQNVPYLSALKNRTVELVASTIVTDPLPSPVLNAIMPAAQGARRPFETDEVDIAYGTVDRSGRIIFGAKVGVFDSNPAQIADKLFELFPTLQDFYKAATGNALHYKPLVTNETLNFTADLLPNVGRLGQEGRVRYVHALGGQGIAMGTILGKVAAEDIFGSLAHKPEMGAQFDLLSSVKHAWTPSWKPLRRVATYIALQAETLGDKLSGLFARTPEL